MNETAAAPNFALQTAKPNSNAINATNVAPPSERLMQAVALHQAGRLDEAEAVYRSLLRTNPDDSDALHYLGLIAFQRSRFREAVGLIEAAIRINRRIPAFHCNLGNAYKALGRLDSAVAAFLEAVRLDPQFQAAHSNLGNTLKEQGRFDEAVASHRAALALRPDFAEAHNNLGVALRGQGNLHEAVASYRMALALNPNYAEAHSNLGVALQEQGQRDEAIAHFQRALQLNPRHAETYSNLGIALKEQGKLKEAVGHYLHALALQPEFAEAHYNLANALQDQGKPDDAIEHYRKALAIKPDYVGAYDNLLFTKNFHPSLSAEEIYRAYQEYDALRGIPLRSAWQPHRNDRNPERRLRVGYVSPDFRSHAVSCFAEPILANHDQSRVEVFCYAEVVREDEVTARFRQLAGHWHSTVGMSDDAVANMIREHRIDILIDLAGHSANNRLMVFARKPAPLQLTYLGYLGSTGLSAMDYLIADRHVIPEGSAEACYAERVLRLPDSLWCYRPPAGMPEISPLPALTRGHLTFGSFNGFNKIHQSSLELWAELLRALPAARLMMLTVPEGETRQRLQHRFAELGIAPQRLELHGKLPSAEFRRKFHEVDIALDPVSVNGGTTTFETLWMGVPVLSLAGTRFPARAGLSILNTAGLADFAVTSPGDFIRTAVHFASNLPLLAEIRTGLRTRIAASPLTDEAAFTRHLENRYREIWQKWCAA